MAVDILKKLIPLVITIIALVILGFLVGRVSDISLAWMQWTAPTAAFFIVLGVALTTMTIWDTYTPSVKRQGFLPVPFTRGERFFISVMIFLATMVLWVAFATGSSLWWAVGIAAVIIFVVARYG